MRHWHVYLNRYPWLPPTLSSTCFLLFSFLAFWKITTLTSCESYLFYLHRTGYFYSCPVLRLYPVRNNINMSRNKIWMRCSCINKSWSFSIYGQLRALSKIILDGKWIFPLQVVWLTVPNKSMVLDSPPYIFFINQNTFRTNKNV